MNKGIQSVVHCDTPETTRLRKGVAQAETLEPSEFETGLGHLVHSGLYIYIWTKGRGKVVGQERRLSAASSLPQPTLSWIFLLFKNREKEKNHTTVDSLISDKALF